MLLPSLPEQHEIVRRVESLFGLADRIEARLGAAQSTVTRLTPAILAKAFRGELVPQDPNDEPAVELLERMKSFTKAKPKSVPKKRVTRKRPTTEPKSMDDLKTKILKIIHEPLSFNELREAASTSYETLQETLFELLAENPPRIRQEFDKKAKMMRFRVSKL